MRKGNGKSNGRDGKPRNARESLVEKESWTDQVAHLIHHEGLSRDKARDQVIMGELRAGHTGALAALLIEGHVPSPSVRFTLALMLLENEEAEAALDRHHADPASLWLPHRLIIKARPAEPRHARGVERAKAAGEAGGVSKSGPVMRDLGYEAAIARLDQAVLAKDLGPASPTHAERPPAPSKRRK